MAKYRLISFKGSPWVQRVAIVLREKGVDFELFNIESGNRPEWFGTVSPHGKVPVLEIDGRVTLFESNAISEYLDDAIQPKLHPEYPVERAIHRAWTDYIPTFAGLLGAIANAKTIEAQASGWEGLSKGLARLEDALKKTAGGPYFSGAHFSLVDAGYAPFMQRLLILEDLAGTSLSVKFPAVRRWAQALVDRPSTHTFPPDVFRLLYLEGVKRRGGLIAQQALSA